VKPTPELLAYFGENQGKIQAFATLLKTTGIEHGLIGPKEGDRRLADIGSGAGLPGVVIALARPDLKVTLIEPLQRRVEFLNQVIAELELPVKVVRGRAEAVKMQFEVVTARAVAPLEKLIQISWHMIPKGGSLLAIKGESAAQELAATKLKKGAIAKLHEISLPNLPVARVVEVLKGA